MIHFQTNPNLFYFNTTDLTNNCLYIQDQADYGFLGKKTLMYICQVSYSPDKQNESAYNNLQNTRYLAIEQTNVKTDVYKVKLLSQSTSDVKNITVSYINKKNVFDLKQFVNNGYIKTDKIYSVLLRDIQIVANDSSDVTIPTINEEINIKYKYFSSNELNQNNQITFQFEEKVDFVVVNNQNNVVKDINFCFNINL